MPVLTKGCEKSPKNPNIPYPLAGEERDLVRNRRSDRKTSLRRRKGHEACLFSFDSYQKRFWLNIDGYRVGPGFGGSTK
jgi:hypothetical protein